MFTVAIDVVKDIGSSNWRYLITSCVLAILPPVVLVSLSSKKSRWSSVMQVPSITQGLMLLKIADGLMEVIDGAKSVMGSAKIAAVVNLLRANFDMVVGCLEMVRH